MKRIAIAVFALTALVGCETEENPDADCDSPCFVPPLPTCAGDVLNGYETPGGCVDGECLFIPLNVDCAARGQICANSACVDPPTPCDDVTCDSPPEPFCDPDDDGVIVAFAATGTCVVNEDQSTSCDYVREPDNCRDWEMCAEGECVDRPCAFTRCDEPPEATCDGTAVVTFAEVGECQLEDESCAYAEASRTDCADSSRFCSNARCVFGDPCEGVLCEERPDNFCAGDVLTTYRAGACSSGDCDYGETVTNCAVDGRICDPELLACRDRLPCEGISCDAPPRDRCVDNTVVSYTAGTCTADVCDYPSTSVDCDDTDQVCRSGACVDRDPCDGTSCLSPPSAFCTDDVAHAFANPGVCTDGLCDYTETTEDCTVDGRVCSEGACQVLDLCADVECDEPPASTCAGDDLLSYVVPARCVEGVCQWTLLETDCTESGLICMDDACQEDPDPCAGRVCDTPPEPECINRIYLTYDGLGMCVEGDCEYDDAEVFTDCEDTGEYCAAEGCVPAGRTLLTGDAVVTELFVGTDGDAWIEIRDLTGRNDLSGLILRDQDNVLFELPAGTRTNEHGLIVVASSLDAIAGTPTVVWPAEFSLAPNDGTVQLIGAEGIDTVRYDTGSGWPITTARAVQLSFEFILAADNDAPSHWCESPYQVNDFRRGTPNLPNGVCESDAAAFELRVDEFMVLGNARPGGVEQWFEVVNQTTSDPVDMSGFYVISRSNSFVIPAGTVVGPSERLVFGSPTLGGPGVDIAYPASFVLGADDELQILAGPTILEFLDWSGWSIEPGRSLQYASGLPSHEEASWCPGSVEYTGTMTNYGTPGEFGECD